MKTDELASIATPAVPLTVEGSCVLHQMLRVRWPELRKNFTVLEEAAKALSQMESEGQSALYTLLGHKGDLMLVHFRKSFEELSRLELQLAQLGFWDCVEQTHSYLSMVELGLYESSQKTYNSLAERGVAAFSPEWDAEIKDTLARQREAMSPRLFPKVPESKYICFYPMDRKRGESVNWYTVPMPERQRMMHEHGMVGRRYAGEVRQVISGSIGFDDWEWGVDLWSNDPLQFKKLIYEMRFDEVSAVYALFGSFYVGVRLRPADLATVLRGEATV
jgi:chlorite dismutase